MKRGTPEHPKTIRLAELLTIHRPYAVGVLELLWHFTSDYAPAGDIGRFSDQEICKCCYWPGDPGVLIDALQNSHWIEPHKKHRLIVHGWSEHADDATNVKLARAGKFFADGKKPSVKRLSENERNKINTLYEKSVRTKSARRAHIERTKSAQPLPVPYPEPEPEPEPLHSDYCPGFEKLSAEFRECFVELLRTHPTPVIPFDASMQWVEKIRTKRITTEHLPKILTTHAEFAASQDWLKDDKRWCVSLANFIEREIFNSRPKARVQDPNRIPTWEPNWKDSDA